MSKKVNVIQLLPVLFSFYVMGFCDVVGISTTYVKDDFQLSETLSGFIPSMVFLWFLLLAVPVALIMNRVGRKKMVQISNIITIIGMILPFITYNLTICMFAFALLGIGNTILQVSLNPLITNLVNGDKLTSALTAGQVIKAVSSFMGPIIALIAVNQFGNWQYLFPIFAAITLISSVWLFFTTIPKEEKKNDRSSYKKTFELLRDKKILLLFTGIIFTVGLDVGLNTVTPKLLIERCGSPITEASLGSSVYFFCRTAGSFIGAFLLAKISDSKYLKISAIVLCAAIASLFLITGKIPMLIMVGVAAFALSCVFPIIYSLALRHSPKKENEISGLMITGVCGGAILPPLMGWFTDLLGSQNGSVIVLTIGAVYLIICSYLAKENNMKLA